MNTTACPRCQCEESPLDELGTLEHCFSAVADLLNPEKDLHAVSRDDFSLLLGYLVRRHRQALAACHKGAA